VGSLLNFAFLFSFTVLLFDKIRGFGEHPNKTNLPKATNPQCGGRHEERVQRGKMWAGSGLLNIMYLWDDPVCAVEVLMNYGRVAPIRQHYV